MQLDYNGEYTWNNGTQLALSGRSKNDKNWENWERIREQKLEKMKNICFESYRQSKRDRMLQAKPKPRQLDSTWYTDNIYSNRSEDLDEDYVPDCIKYGTYRKLRNIREHEDEVFVEGVNGMGMSMGMGMGMSGGGVAERIERRGEGEGSPGYGLHRSTSCKEFQYPKSQSWCFDGNVFEAGGVGGGAAAAGGGGGATATSITSAATTTAGTTSILKNRGNVPKSYSFSASTKTMPFDVMDYELPPASNLRREKQEAFRRSMASFYSNSLDESALTHSCCAREHCTNAKCLLDDIYPSYTQRRGWRRGPPTELGMYSAGASGGSNRNLHAAAAAAAAAAVHTDWLLDERNDHHRVATAPSYSRARYSRSREREQAMGMMVPPPQSVAPPLPPPPPTMVCCCAADDYCCHRQQQHHMARSRTRPLHCPGHHPAAEEEEHLHCRYDTDLEHFIRDERERLLLQDKFLDEDERYLSAAAAAAAAATAPGPSLHYAANYRRPARSKSLLEVQPPSRYDDDSCSDSTEMDLEDFNIDLEKYWEELEKPPSPIDLDMQRRNMHSNLKVKNVNVGCYNNGRPIDMHDREQERMLIKKSLLEGMPSPPQLEPGGVSQPGIANNVSDYHFFEHAGSPLHRSYQYGHKIYPTPDTLPSYKYNNFYPEHSVGPVQTRQPTAGVHHPSAGGHSALSLINNIFSIYKPNKYSPHNCQMNIETKPEPCKKMNVPSTRRPLGAPHSEYMHSMKRPLIVSTEQPHFKIIPEKTGLKISPLFSYDDYGEKQPVAPHKLTSTQRPLMLPH